MAPAEIVRALDAQARQGKLAGFAALDEGGPDLFKASAYAEPFDREIIASVGTAAGPGHAGTSLTFRLRVLPRTPLIYTVVTAVSIWPGVWLTDSMLRTYFDWYRIQTWWWYLPLTILPLAWWLPRTWKKSVAMARESALEVIGKVAAATGGSAGGA